MTVMPKNMYNVIRLTYTRDSPRIIQLDDTNIKIIGVVKDILMKLKKYPKISIV